jgi:putative endonuclease
MVSLAAGWRGLQRAGLRRLDSLAARRVRLSGEAPLAPHLVTGLLGEREALFHLQGLGYIVVARRWKSVKLRGDVDLIAWDGEHLCFIEVKTRTVRDPMEPAEAAVDSAKQEMLRKMAKAYLRIFARELREGISVRFDVVSVYLLPRDVERDGVQFEVRKGAFGWE